MKQQYVDAMGVELGEIHNRLWNECSWVHMKWGEYVTIFGTSEERVDLMNRAAPAFTRLMQDALWHDVLLHLCRLTDPVMTPGKGGKRENLTIKQLRTLQSQNRNCSQNSSGSSRRRIPRAALPATGATDTSAITI